jgi:hypothetical protein
MDDRFESDDVDYQRWNREQVPSAVTQHGTEAVGHNRSIAVSQYRSIAASRVSPSVAVVVLADTAPRGRRRTASLESALASKPKRRTISR